MSRALRRHHRARIRKRAFRNLIDMYSSSWFAGSVFYPAPKDGAVDGNHPWVYRRAENFTVCSCVMCGNPRRFKGGNGPERTRQEQKADLDFREWLDNL